MSCDNIMDLAWVYWIIYSRGVVQYIQRREAPRDILLNPEGVYSPIYPCHAHYIITMYTLDSTKNCQKVYIEIPANKISENILFNAL